MATLKTIRKRIGSVRNTQKITKAMKMVAAAKLRRAQGAVVGSRPFLAKLRETVEMIVSKLPDKDLSPVLKPRDEIRKVRVYIFSSNRGLCGGFNSNLMRCADSFRRELEKRGLAYELIVIGKKGRDFLGARRIPIAESILTWADKITFDEAIAATEKLVRDYESGAIDEVYLVYNKFVSAITQKPTVEKLLPVAVDRAGAYGIECIFEPDKQAILGELLPRYFASILHMIHKESLASELGARMAAMESATQNASEMIGKLTLQYNRARQASITRELLDIVNGAESLKG